MATKRKRALTKKQLNAAYRELYKYCEAVASLYGSEIHWFKGTGGFWDTTNVIRVGNQDNYFTTITVFCHELGHYLNYLDGEYPLFHNRYKDMAKIFPNYNMLVEYAHAAEIYTEKRGRELCGMFFPGIKYKAFYNKRSLFSKGFLFGYYMTSFSEGKFSVIIN